MAEAATLTRPVLTLPEAEAAELRAAYAAAGAILEYGSGGSTALAAEMPGKRVFAVESDAAWLDGLRSWFEVHPPRATVTLHHADIGPTGKWGKPATAKSWRSFHGYPTSVWERDDFVQPDVVLVDGRFRAACFLAVLFMTRAPLTVLFDDYADRPGYHDVERFARPVSTVGRMARFEIAPQRIDGADLPRILEMFARTQ